MRKSIKIMVGLRVVAALIAVLLFSFMIIWNINRIKETEASSNQTNVLLSQAQKAEAAHYKWVNNLCDSLYSDTEFSGSIDPTTCVLGQWIYGEAGTDDDSILKLRDEMEPLHKQLHESATHVLKLMKTNPAEAQEYYQDTIRTNLSTLIGMLNEVVEKGTQLTEESGEKLQNIISTMRNTAIGGFILVLICLISLIAYVLHQIVKPILLVTDKTRPLQEGKLEMELRHKTNNELGDLISTLQTSMKQIQRYVQDINHIMSELSNGNFDVHTSIPFVGDFRSIEESIASFTSTMSTAISRINEAEDTVSSNARHLSGSAQALAQGATQQASAVEELSSTLNNLSQSADQNVKLALEAQSNAYITGEQVTLSSQQMEHMIAAMEEIAEASQQIGKIISTIENIASQTNILALNAAVEATNAGAAGKGFTVVSTEIRSLANQSDDAAKATKELIENCIQAAEKGRKIVEEVSDTLQTTLNLVMQSNSNIGTIAEEIKNEATSITQVSEGIRQISDVVQSNSAGSEESAAVSTELFEQVRLLQEQTSRFRLKQK